MASDRWAPYSSTLIVLPQWDHCELTDKQVAEALGHDYPIGDYKEAIRKLYQEHAPARSSRSVERAIADAEERGVLPALYRRSYLDYAYGGATVRHIILVRHGQYEEQRELYRPLAKADRDFGMPMDEVFLDVDSKQVLTELGRRQAEATGVKLRQLLAPVFETPGRETHVRMHVSSLERAKETADIIGKHLPSSVRRLPPDPNLAEGWPLAHRIPFPQGAPQEESRLVHVEGARIEAAFRGLFYRGKPGQPPTREEAKAAAAKLAASDSALPPPQPQPIRRQSRGAVASGADAIAAVAAGAGGGVSHGPSAGAPSPHAPPPHAQQGMAGGAGGGAPTSAPPPADVHAAAAAAAAAAPAVVPRHEYDIVVCHGNVIRYFALRALQLPPEAWLRLCTFNCSLTHLVIWPHGSVSCNSIGDVGHLSLEETTFSMHEGYEW